MLSSLSSLNLSLEFIDCAHCIELSKGYPRIWHRFATQEQRTIHKDKAEAMAAEAEHHH
jgi:hypothetical protein